MVCTSCGKREATVHITQNVNGKTTRIDLCPVCAKEQGYLGETGDMMSGFFGTEPFGGGGLNLFQMAGGMSGIPGSTFTGERCAYCGTSFEEFRTRGLLGCTHCYEEFGQRLLPVIRRIQAGEVHTGRRPAGAPAPEAKAPPKEPKRSFLKRPTRIPKKKPEDGPGAAPLKPATTPAQPAAAVPTPAPPAPPAPEETEILRLRRAQAEAVQAEDYEKAARLRDRIREMEEKEKGGSAG